MTCWVRFVRYGSARLVARPALLTLIACLLAAQLGGCIFRCDAGDGSCDVGLLSLPLLDPASNQAVVVTVERSSDKSVVVTCTWQAEPGPPAWVCDPAPSPGDSPLGYARSDTIANAAFGYHQLGADTTILVHVKGASEVDVALTRHPTSSAESCHCDTGIFELGVAPLESVGAQVAPR